MSQTGQSTLSAASCTASLSDTARTSFFLTTAPPGRVNLLMRYNFTWPIPNCQRPEAKHRCRPGATVMSASFLVFLAPASAAITVTFTEGAELSPWRSPIRNVRNGSKADTRPMSAMGGKQTLERRPDSARSVTSSSAGVRISRVSNGIFRLS